MKPNAFLRRFLAITGSAALTTPLANATTLYWDVNGTTAGFSTVVGAWDTTNNFWNTDSTGGAGTLSNTTTAGDDLIIKQATTNTGNITVSGTQLASSITFAANVGPTTTITGGAITIGGTGASSGIFQQSTGANTISTGLTLRAASSAFNFSNSSSGLLTIGAVTGAASSGTQTITVGSSSSGNITLNGIIGNGANGGKVALEINNTSTGFTTLSGVNTFTGGITVNSGILKAGVATSAFGTAATAGVITLANVAGVTLDLNANNQSIGSLAGGGTTGGIVALGGSTLTVGGNNTSTTFAGNISATNGSFVKNGNGDLTLSGNITASFSTTAGGGLRNTSANGGKLILSGTNTYSGRTEFGIGNPGGGDTIFQGIQALSSNTTLAVYHVGGTGSYGSFRILDDNGGTSNGTISKTAVNLRTDLTNTFASIGVFVGNNNTLNGGNSAGTSTGNTIALGDLVMSQNATGNTKAIMNVAGADGYRLQINNVTPTLQAASGAAYTVQFVPTTAPITIAGTVRQATGSAWTTTLNLDGTTAGIATGNFITGNILNSGDGAPKLLNVTKTNSSTWTLAGTNSYTGGTTISAGILRFTGNSSAANGAVSVTAGALGGNGGSLGGAVTISGTGGINLADGSVGNLTLGGSTLANTAASAGGNNYIFDLASAGATTDQIIATSAAFSMTTTGAVVVSPNQLGGSGNRLTAGTYDLMTVASGLTAGGGQFQLATTKAFGQTFSLANTTSTVLKLTTTQVTSTVANTTLSGTSPSWLTGGNFSGGSVPDYGSNVTINSAIGTSPLNGSTDINSLTYGTSATTATTISAGTATAGTPASMLVLEASSGTGITVNTATSVGHAISANIGLASNQTWNIGGSTSGTVDALTITGTVSDFGGGYGITKTGSGLLNFRAAPTPTYTGTTTINGGAILFAGNLPTGNITINGGVLEAYFNNVFSRPLGATAGSVQITGGVSGFSGQGATGSSFAITGTSPIVWGSGYFNPSEFVLQSAFTNNNGAGSFTSNIDLNGANRTIRSDQTLASVTSGGGTFSGNFSNSTGTAKLTKTGVGLHYLSGTNTYNGGTDITQGTLIFSALASMPATGAVSVSSGATLGVAVAGTGTTWGAGTGNGGIAGLTAGLGGQAGSTVSFAGNSNLLLNVTGIVSESNTITNGGATNLSLIKMGTSQLNLSGANTYTGGTAVLAGTLGFANGALGSTGTINASGGTLLWLSGNTQDISSRLAMTTGTTSTFNTNGNDVTFANAIGSSTTGALVKAGLGTLTLQGQNTYTGTTTVSAGTLKLQSGASTITQTLGGLSNNSGEGTLLSNKSGAGNITTTFSSYSRTAGAVGNIVSTGGTNGTDNTVNITGTAGFIDKGLYYNGSEFAARNATNGYVRALAYGTDTNAAAVNTITSGRHVKLTSTPGGQASISLLSLNLQGSGVNWTNNAAQTLTVPGIIKSGGGSVSTISGGSVTTSANAELVVRTDTTSDSLTISSNLTQGSGGLTKSGAGTLTLQGTNTYTGNTIVTSGLLKLDSATAIAGGIGNTGGLSAILLNGGVIGLTANSGNFTRGISSSGTTSLTVTNNGGGFAAFGGDRTVNFGGAGAAFNWNASNGSGWGSSGGALMILSHPDSDAKVIVANGIKLADNISNISQTVRVDDGSASIDAEFSGIVSDGIAATNNGLIKTGAGTLLLSNTNTYTGATLIRGGTLALSNGSAILNTGAVDVGNGVGGATLDLNNFNETIGALTLNQGTVQSTGGTNTLTTTGVTVTGTPNTVASSAIIVGNASFGSGAALALNGALTGNATVGNGTLSGSGSVSGTTGVTGGTVNGSGLVLTGTTTFNSTGNILSGTVTSTGGVTLAAGAVVTQTGTLTGNVNTTDTGTFKANGSVTGNVTVANGGTLQGNGSIGGSVTIQLGGTMATGNSIESLGTGTLNLSAGSTFAYEIDSDALPGVAGDLTYVTGNLNLATSAGSLLTISELGTLGAWTAGDKLTLISYTGSWNNELFTYLGGTLADDSNFTLDGVQWTFNYNDTLEGTNYTGDSAGSFVTMTVVPEPGAALIGSLGLLALLRRRRN